MTPRMTVTEVKARFFALLDGVEAGEEFEITRHGVAIALLVPVRGPGALRGRFTGVTSSAASDEDLFTTGAWHVQR